MPVFMRIASNIWKLYCIKGLRYFLVMMPIVTIFYNSIGMNQYEIMLSQVAFSLSIILFEIPSGYFSDRVSRKITLVIASCFALSGMFLYALSTSFFHIIIAEIILGIGASCMSGTDSAMMYDTLLAMDQKERYKTIKGRVIAFQSVSEAVAGIVGWFLAVISIRYPLWAQFFCMLPILPLSLSLVEPKRYSEWGTISEIVSMAHVVKFAMHKNKNILWLMIYSGVLSAGTFSFVWFIQPYLQSLGTPLAWYGVLWAIFNLSIGVFALGVARYEHIFSRKYALINLLLMVVVGYICVGLLHSFVGIIFIGIFYCVRAWQEPIIEEYVHILTPSHMRATVLSIKGMFWRVVFIFLGPLLGAINGIYSLSYTFFFAAGLFLVFWAISLLQLARHKAL